MNKLFKGAVSMLMSLAIAVCAQPINAGATGMVVNTNEENGIATASYNIGVPYEKSNQRGTIRVIFTSAASDLMVSYSNLTKKNVYIRLYVYTSDKEFPVKDFYLNSKGAKSYTYPLKANNLGKVTIEAYQYEQSGSSYQCVDMLRAIMQ